MTAQQYFLLLYLMFGVAATSAAQELKFGVGISAGTNWEIRRVPLNSMPDESFAIISGLGYGIAAEASFVLGNFGIGIRPELLRQRGQVLYNTPGDGGMSSTRPLVPLALLLPARLTYYVGREQWQPMVSAGGGLMFTLGQSAADGPKAEEVLPYLEVAIGAKIRRARYTLRPEITIRNGTTELFNPAAFQKYRGAAGQRWAYVAVGITVLR